MEVVETLHVVIVVHNWGGGGFVVERGGGLKTRMQIDGGLGGVGMRGMELASLQTVTRGVWDVKEQPQRNRELECSGAEQELMTQEGLLQAKVHEEFSTP